MNTTASKDFECYALGLIYASICTSLPVEEAIARANDEYPTGLDHGWSLCSEAFRDGSPNPCACPDAPETHRHYLLGC